MVMADNVQLRVTGKIKKCLEEFQDKKILEKVKQTDSGEVIEYKYLLKLFTESQKHGT